MDPATPVVVSAIAAGAVAGVGDSTTQVVKDAYSAFSMRASSRSAVSAHAMCMSG